jgi:hypothetical protein
VGTFRVLLVDSGSASRVEVSKLLASCRYQVRRPSCEQQMLLCLSSAPPWCCSQASWASERAYTVRISKSAPRLPAAVLHAHSGASHSFWQSSGACSPAIRLAVTQCPGPVSHDEGLPAWPIFRPADGGRCATLWRSKEQPAVTTGSSNARTHLGRPSGVGMAGSHGTLSDADVLV